MKRKVLTGINALIALLLGILGLNGCFRLVEYGTPYATFEAAGTITDEDNKPLENIRVTLKDRYRPNRDYRRTMPDVYTADDGTYTRIAITAELCLMFIPPMTEHIQSAHMVSSLWIPWISL